MDFETIDFEFRKFISCYIDLNRYLKTIGYIKSFSWFDMTYLIYLSRRKRRESILKISILKELLTRYGFESEYGRVGKKEGTYIIGPYRLLYR